MTDGHWPENVALQKWKNRAADLRPCPSFGASTRGTRGEGPPEGASQPPDESASLNGLECKGFLEGGREAPSLYFPLGKPAARGDHGRVRGGGDPAMAADLRGIMRGMTRAGRYPALLLPAPPLPCPCTGRKTRSWCPAGDMFTSNFYSARLSLRGEW